MRKIIAYISNKNLISDRSTVTIAILANDKHFAREFLQIDVLQTHPYVHSSQYFENETNGPGRKIQLFPKILLVSHRIKRKEEEEKNTSRKRFNRRKKKCNTLPNENQSDSELTEENFIKKKSLRYVSLTLPFLFPLPSSPSHLYFTSIVSFFHSSLYHLNFLLPSSISFFLSPTLTPVIFFLPSFFYLALSFFCTVPRHQSFVGALAGTTSRFEISTARWKNGGGDDVARHPLVFSQSVESYLSLFQAPSSLPSRAFALLDYVITTLIVPPLSREGGREGERAIDLLGSIHTKPRDSCARAKRPPLPLEARYIYFLG